MLALFLNLVAMLTALYIIIAMPIVQAVAEPYQAGTLFTWIYGAIMGPAIIYTAGKKIES